MSTDGSAYIFEKGNYGVWSFFQKIVASDREVSGTFGTNVDIYENVIVVDRVLD